jgi:hypothetical protein
LTAHKRTSGSSSTIKTSDDLSLDLPAIVVLSIDHSKRWRPAALVLPGIRAKCWNWVRPDRGFRNWLGPSQISQRLQELDEEWDIERAIEANAAAISLFGLTCGLLDLRTAGPKLVVPADLAAIDENASGMRAFWSFINSRNKNLQLRDRHR